MGILDNEVYINDLIKLLQRMEVTQWDTPTIKTEFITFDKITTREDLRNMEMKPGFTRTKTSGSTGEPVTIEKTQEDFLWYSACVIREILWKKWDVRNNVAVIKGIGEKPIEYNDWGIPRKIFPIQGKMYQNYFDRPISELQQWLELINPDYIQCYPSIFKQIDTSKIPNFKEWKGTSELGGTCYSTEECGVIAIQCPDNPKNYHVMENQYIEVDDDGGMLITTLTNPYIKKYKHGDHVVLGECTCGRGLQTITEIKGRVRNMFTLPNGEKKWPTIGSLNFSDFGIKRFKAIQHTLEEVELQIICDELGDREDELKKLVQESLGTPINVTITHVTEFPNYKFEEFVSEI
jgi:phenylacetate-CoA ligase